MTLQREGILLVSLYEQHYWEKNSYPSYEYISDHSGLDPKRVVEITSKPAFTAALEARGLPSLFKNAPVGSLTAEQVVACNLVLNVYDKRSLQTKLKSLNLSTNKWQAWLNDPVFSQYVNSVIESRFAGIERDAKLSLAQNVQNGDLNSIKFYMELVGKYSPNSSVQINLNIVVAKMMEILVKYVPSSALELAAQELEAELARLNW